MNACKYTAFVDIGKIIKNKKYDVISIDGPKGSDYYSRRDIIEFIPDVLEKSFVILIDDSHREGEKTTIRDIKKVLEEAKIEYNSATYTSLKNCHIITSKDNSFLCSL